MYLPLTSSIDECKVKSNFLALKLSILPTIIFRAGTWRAAVP